MKFCGILLPKNGLGSLILVWVSDLKGILQWWCKIVSFPRIDNSGFNLALVVKNNYKIREKSDTPVCEIVALEKVDNWV